MSELKVLIVEDELLIAEDLNNKLKKSGYSVTEIVDNGEDAIKSISDNPPDIILMDIGIKGELNGIELAEKIRKKIQCPFIYLTHYSDSKTWQEAKKTGPSAYIIKPFRERDLNIAIELAIQNTSDKLSEGEKKGESESGDIYLLEDRVFVKHNHRFERVNLNDILYLKAEGSYTEIKTVDKDYIFSETLNIFEGKLPFKQFIRIHRSWVINVNRIEAFEENSVVIGNRHIPISKVFKSEFKKRFRFV